MTMRKRIEMSKEDRSDIASLLIDRPLCEAIKVFQDLEDQYGSDATISIYGLEDYSYASEVEVIITTYRDETDEEYQKRVEANERAKQKQREKRAKEKEKREQKKREQEAFEKELEKELLKELIAKHGVPE